MDELSRHNRDRWNALAEAGVTFSRPWLDLDEADARQRVDPLGLLGGDLQAALSALYAVVVPGEMTATRTSGRTPSEPGQWERGSHECPCNLGM